VDKQQAEVKITLRMPADVAEGVRRSAQVNDRSLNGEIVRALLDYLTQRKRAQ
jgi:hypothetical protein